MVSDGRVKTGQKQTSGSMVEIGATLASGIEVETGSEVWRVMDTSRPDVPSRTRRRNHDSGNR